MGADTRLALGRKWPRCTYLIAFVALLTPLQLLGSFLPVGCTGHTLPATCTRVLGHSLATMPGCGARGRRDSTTIARHRLIVTQQTPCRTDRRSSQVEGLACGQTIADHETDRATTHSVAFPGRRAVVAGIQTPYMPSQSARWGCGTTQPHCPLLAHHP